MTLILISCQQQGRPFDYYYYVKVFQRHFAIFMPKQGSFCHENSPPPNENPPIPSVLSHVSVSELYMLYTG